jgi:glycosyltransferase involved in cell wall biosynthesis
MRVMQVMAGAAHGGAEAFFTRLAPALDRAGVAQRLVIRRHAERAALLRAAGLTPLEFAFGGPLDIVTGHRLNRAIKRFQPEIVLSWMNRATQFCPIGRHILAARLGGYYKLAPYRRCDHLIGNTRDIRDYLVDAGWPRGKVWHLPNFVDAATAAPVARASLDTPDDAPLLLALGRLHENKAFDVLIDAVAQTRGTYLWLAGAGPLRAPLQAQAARLGILERVRFLGWRADTAALLAACDALICSSRHEPLGNVVLEAWAHGRPVIATRAQGPAALIEDGVSGILTPLDDADALAAAIRRVTGSPDLGGTLVSGGRNAYEADFTEEIVVSRYLEFFASVTN